ncbi:unnamed protein product [Linum tenue]|uniref:RNase H type-1 domain-containing protein n=2 Tax=Linum tenue TaxID=586396 RepID=A0AAV0IZ25_9ROSI|nr:unnamed protein product [Linum tenue]
MGAFVENLGVCTITRAEIIAAIRGLQLVWRNGYRKVLLQMDSTTAINILTSSEHMEQRYFILVQQFQELLNKSWEVKISHIYREGNKVTDFLANKVHSSSIGYHDFEVSDSGLSFWILYDILGISQTRLI